MEKSRFAEWKEYVEMEQEAILKETSSLTPSKGYSLPIEVFADVQIDLETNTSKRLAH
jgi:hypothetical protein